MYVDNVNVGEYAQVFKYDRKNIKGSDNITKKIVFVTEKCSFFIKNFLSVIVDHYNPPVAVWFAFFAVKMTF